MNNLIKDMKCLGCRSTRDATLCAFTYLELLRRQDEKLVFNVSYHYNVQFSMLYCQAQSLEDGPSKLHVSVSSSEDLNPQTWDKYFYLITDSHEPNCVVLVIWETDSTFLFYEISKGLGSPPSGYSERSKIKKSLGKKNDLEPCSSKTD